MAAPKKNQVRPARRAPKKPTWRDYVPDHPANKILTAAAVITALAYMGGYLKPIIDSGPLPLSSRSELSELKADVEDHVDTLKKGVDETLEVAKAANSQAQQAIQTSNDYRMDRLLQQKIQLEDQIAKNPNDATLKASLARTNIDIAKLTAAPAK